MIWPVKDTALSGSLRATASATRIRRPEDRSVGTALFGVKFSALAPRQSPLLLIASQWLLIHFALGERSRSGVAHAVPILVIFLNIRSSESGLQKEISYCLAITDSVTQLPSAVFRAA